MHRIIVVSLLLCSTTWAEVSDLDLALWENRLFKSTPRSADLIVSEMYHKLPREQPWPERAKVLLLDIINKHYANGKYRELCCEDPNYEWSYDPAQMAAFQDDIRFLPYLVETFGSRSTVIGLARLGEPALPYILNKITAIGWEGQQTAAMRALNLMADNKAEFLEKGHNPELIKQALVLAAQKGGEHSTGSAVKMLGKWGDSSVIPMLRTISLNHVHTEVRASALEVIQVLRFKAPLR